MENEFLKLYDEMSSLWEYFDSKAESVKVPVEIKNRICEIETPFMTVPQFLEKKYYVPGIYIWKRLPYADNPKPAYYVGKAMNIHKRTRQHRTAGYHDSPALHAALRKHRTSDTDIAHDQFEIAILEFCMADDAVLKQREADWIAKLDTYNDHNDYNLTPGGDNGPGKDPKVTIEMFEEIIGHLQANRLTIRAIGALYELSKTTIANINDNKCQYVEKFAKKLNLNLNFPIRQPEEMDAVAKDAVKAGIAEKSKAKYWELTLVKYDWADETHTKIIKVSTESLGIYAGKASAWAKICELERSKFRTADTEKQIQQEEDRSPSKRSLVQAGAIGFDLLRTGSKQQDMRYKRKYTVTRVEPPALADTTDK